MEVTQNDRTNQSHKQITQNDRTRQDDVMSVNKNDEQRFQMLQSNSGVYGGPETVNLTEKHPSRRDE